MTHGFDTLVFSVVVVVVGTLVRRLVVLVVDIVNDVFDQVAYRGHFLQQIPTIARNNGAKLPNGTGWNEMTIHGWLLCFVSLAFFFFFFL